MNRRALPQPFAGQPDFTLVQSNQGSHDEQPQAGATDGFARMPGRITSYNVCYTKLLRKIYRYANEQGITVFVNDESRIPAKYRRITSYNVCYTKLLRACYWVR